MERDEPAGNPFIPDMFHHDAEKLDEPAIFEPESIPFPNRDADDFTPASRPASPARPSRSLEPLRSERKEARVLNTSEPPPSTITETPSSSPAVQTTQQKDPQPASLFSESSRGHGLQVIGQFSDLYIFCSNSEGLLVIDQHAAHERLLYEEFRRQFTGNRVVRQNLLFPETVELTLFQSQLVEKHAEELEHIGFNISEFGGNSFLISAVPALAGQCSPTELFFDVLEQFGSESNRRESGDRIDTILATMACRAAVKAGTALGAQEIDALLTRMAQADLFSHCPHGRPVVKQFSRNEIKKWFYRT
jgi:DNA mismatch repair protein MutL